MSNKIQSKKQQKGASETRTETKSRNTSEKQHPQDTLDMQRQD